MAMPHHSFPLVRILPPLLVFLLCWAVPAQGAVPYVNCSQQTNCYSCLRIPSPSPPHSSNNSNYTTTTASTVHHASSCSWSPKYRRCFVTPTAPPRDGDGSTRSPPEAAINDEMAVAAQVTAISSSVRTHLSQCVGHNPAAVTPFDCADISSCSECTLVDGCGWNAANGWSARCAKGNKDGPSIGSTRGWVWLNGGCPPVGGWFNTLTSGWFLLLIIGSIILVCGTFMCCVLRGAASTLKIRRERKYNLKQAARTAAFIGGVSRDAKVSREMRDMHQSLILEEETPMQYGPGGQDGDGDDGAGADYCVPNISITSSTGAGSGNGGSQRPCELVISSVHLRRVSFHSSDPGTPASAASAASHLSQIADLNCSGESGLSFASASSAMSAPVSPSSSVLRPTSEVAGRRDSNASSTRGRSPNRGGEATPTPTPAHEQQQRPRQQEQEERDENDAFAVAIL